MLHSLRRWMVGKALPGTIAITFAGLCLSPATAAPVEYVKVCSLYGAGFYYIPGTDTCIRIGAGVRATLGTQRNDFIVVPGFNVSGSGGLVGVNGNVLFGIPGTAFSVGPGVTAQWGNITGSTSYAPTGGTYTPRTSFIATYDAMVNLSLTPQWGAFATVGGASVTTRISGTGLGFDASDSNNKWGWAVSGGLRYHSPFIPIDITAQVTHIDVGTANYNLPGTVPVRGNINLFSIGGEYAFTPGGSR